MYVYCVTMPVGPGGKSEYRVEVSVTRLTPMIGFAPRVTPPAVNRRLPVHGSADRARTCQSILTNYNPNNNNNNNTVLFATMLLFVFFFVHLTRDLLEDTWRIASLIFFLGKMNLIQWIDSIGAVCIVTLDEWLKLIANRNIWVGM